MAGAARPFLAGGLALALAAPLVLGGCDQKNAYVAPPPPKVTVAAPVKKAVTRYLEATGNTAAVNTTNLVARVPGFIEAIKYQDGEKVKKGTVLFTIEPETYDLKLKQAQAAQASAEATVRQTKADFDRQTELASHGNAPRSTLEVSTATYQNATANLAQAQINTQLAAMNVDYAHVKAPFDGVVTARKLSIGEYVGGNSQPTVLATIVQLDPIYVNFSINERDVLKIRAEIRARGLTQEDLNKVPVEIGLQTEEGYPHTGRLDYRSPTIDSTTGTLTVRAVFDNPNVVLLPGFFVRVRIPLGAPKDALMVPESALGSDQSGRYLLVVDKDNVVQQRPVELGQREGTLRVIEKGLAADDRVIVSGLLRAIPGQKVEPTTATATAKPAPKG
jgi:RND family efflux transporter MFP subunit